ncbi:unnamed protein product [Clavelina lepadiformis]|uniref:Uncharacterized protein n=1 Tax=Clavelina lepadiformis TaxID=159417 RepID=A0ABP0H1I2_CLALP
MGLQRTIWAKLPKLKQDGEETSFPLTSGREKQPQLKGSVLSSNGLSFRFTSLYQVASGATVVMPLGKAFGTRVFFSMVRVNSSRLRNTV